MNRNLTIRPTSKLSFEEVVEQFQKSAGNMGELSPVMPRSWVGRELQKEPLILRFLEEEDSSAPEAPPATPTA